MSVVFSGNNSGSFISTGNATFIPLPADVDFFTTYNYTQAGNAPTPATCVQAYWQRGMPAGLGLIYYKAGGFEDLNINQATAGAGFSLYNNTINNAGPLVAITAISTGNPPVVSTASTAGLVTGSIVQLVNVVGGQQVSGLQYTVGTVVTNTSFTLANMPAIAAATTGFYRIIPYESYWYPDVNFITKISSVNGNQALVTLALTHDYTVGQEVRFVIPTLNATSYGMTALNEMQGAIVDIDVSDGVSTNTVTVAINVSSYPAFVLPTSALAAAGFTPAQLVPIGENTAVALFNNQNILADATVNNGERGILLAGGIMSPAGSASDVIYWVAGKSFNGI